MYSKTVAVAMFVCLHDSICFCILGRQLHEPNPLSAGVRLQCVRERGCDIGFGARVGGCDYAVVGVERTSLSECRLRCAYIICCACVFTAKTHRTCVDPRLRTVQTRRHAKSIEGVAGGWSPAECLL